MVIDTHQHNWQLANFPYPWIDQRSILGRDYLPDEGLALMQASGVTHCVLVEAGPGSQGELGWMLELATRNKHIAGVVGSIEDMAAAEAVLDAIDPALRPLLKGVRFSGSSDNWTGFDTLAAHHLSCDLLINAATLPAIAEIVAQHPDVTFILDHFAGTRIKPDGYSAWEQDLRPLANLPNVVMKLSGYLTSADPQPLQVQTLEPYIEVALKLFGATRLMYGSDWPVCMGGGTYAHTVDLLKQATAQLSADEQVQIWSKTAVQTYQLAIW